MDKREIRRKYHSMVERYGLDMIINDRFSKALLLLSQKAVPFIEIQGCANITHLKSLYNENEFELLKRNIPYEVSLKHFKNLSLSDIELMKKEHREMDKKRTQFHKKLLTYAHKHYKKDYLDVYIDVLADIEKFKECGELRLELNSSKESLGNLTWRVGLLSTARAWGTEFVRFYGDIFEDENMNECIKESYDYLEMQRKEEAKCPDYKKVHYKSEIHKDRTEAEDNALIEKIKEEFPDNIAFAGDYVFKLMHGHYLFGKYVEFDLNREKEESSKLVLKVDKIKDKIHYLLGK